LLVLIIIILIITITLIIQNRSKWLIPLITHASLLNGKHRFYDYFTRICVYQQLPVHSVIPNETHVLYANSINPEDSTQPTGV
jgi:hypothetical protein